MPKSEFDIEKWIKRFPLSAYDPDAILSDHGPEEICFVEQIRRRALKNSPLSKSVPTDIFVLSFGEPESRDGTKIGGLPYRPRGAKWPADSETGEPMAFVAQFRFAESRDLFPWLPGDVLLACFWDFAAAPYNWFPGPPRFEWYPLGLTDLVTARQLPKPGFEFPTCYGTRHRTVDYATVRSRRKIAAAIPKRIANASDAENLRGIIESVRIWNFLKIGGVPHWVDSDAAAKEGVEKVGRFLCAIPSIVAGNAGRYPWLNRAREVYSGPPLIWSSYGTVNLFIDDRGTILPRIDVE